MQLAESVGYHTIFLGAAVSPERWIDAIAKNDPAIVCIGYRLTPSALPAILDELFNGLEYKGLIHDRLFYFGGTPGCIEVARCYPYITTFFQGEENRQYIMSTLFLDKQSEVQYDPIHDRLALEGDEISPSDLRQIIKQDRYFPMLRHHFGLPTLAESIEGIQRIAESEQVDLISLAPDQNAQEYFFEPDKMNHALDGSGGIPVRSAEDLKYLWQATQRGNYPRLRIYSGTNHLLEWAELSLQTINNAWGTIPLFWYSILDGRSSRTVEEALRENMSTIRWYAERGIPVEINESHHWSLRESSDAIAVADFYIAAYNAKKLGVNTYIAQLMFNTPRLTSAKMDLAKMLAKLELVSELEDDSFVCLKQVRAGLTHFSIDMNIAKGQLAASTLLSLAVKPQIIHVVSFSEADHAAGPDDVIESCKIVRGVLRNAWNGYPDMSIDPDVQERKKHLIKEAKDLLKAMQERYSAISPDPLNDPVCLTQIVKTGLLDAPHLLNNPAALGKIRTMPINGGYDAIDIKENALLEAKRVTILGIDKQFT
ncbi:MAG: methionine synthase [Syntrophomonas sp.]